MPVKLLNLELLKVSMQTQAAYTEKLIEAIPKDTIEQINMRQNERKKTFTKRLSNNVST